MYSLLIVEDEEIIRNVLPVIIDWKSIGIQVAGAVENGREALKFIEDHEVDLVLTDIKMPVMDGLQLSSELKYKHPEIKTILLSAYSEFEYARKGIEYSVYGYLLKSSDEDEIKEYFRSLKEILDNEKSVGTNDTEKLKEHDRNKGEEHLKESNDTHTNRIVNRAIEYIRLNYSADISLADVASHVNVHPVYLSRLFRQESDQTFVNILKEVRIEKAKSMLSESDRKIYEIAYAVGYKKPRYFSEVFKEMTGLTPLEYREKF